MSNKGSAYISVLLIYIMILVFFTFFGITVFQIIITGELHSIKNDMYLINRNVLLSLQRDVMGEDINAVYTQDVKKMMKEEIKRQWNIDVSEFSESGFIYKVDVEEAKITYDKDKMYIESILDIELRPVIFSDILKGLLTFKAKERVKVEKMKGWNYE